MWRPPGWEACWPWFVLATWAFSTLPSTLYSERDGRNLGATIEMPAGSTLDYSQQCADEVGELLRKKKYLQSVVKLTGKKSPMTQLSLGDALTPTEGDYLVGFSCMFQPRERRDLMAYEYVDDLRREVQDLIDDRFPGAKVTLQAETGRPTTEDPVSIKLAGDEMPVLRQIAEDVQVHLRGVRGAVDVRDNLGNERLDVRLVPRREALDFYDISTDDLAAQVRFAMGDQEIGKFAIDGVDEDLEIRLGTAWPSRNGKLGGPTRMEELSTVRAFRQNGETVPLMAVVQPYVQPSPLSITHEDGQRSIAVMSKTKGRVPSEVLAEFVPQLDEMQKSWPAGYSYRVGGEAEDAAEAFGSAGQMLIVALFMVFALMVLLFRSFTQPFIIMLTIPMALIGTFGGFYMLGIPFSFTAMIGLISLIGIVVNDAIVMVETMNEHRRAGMEMKRAAARGASDRLRPILSTSITTTIGLIPLMLSDPMWEPLCGAIIYGLIASTFFSLLVIPALYLLFTKEHRSDLAEGEAAFA